MSVPPVTELTQDVRFAVAMAGGVSLAVWMGGVSREVNLLQQASDSRPRDNGLPFLRPPAGRGAGPDWDARVRTLYRNLLELLDVTITVDVLSGTSAGGINAALLGMSSAGGADLAGLRGLWLRSGALDVLLRDPAEKNPPSLMQGDKVLFEQLADGIRDIHGTCRKLGGYARPATVYITTTMMTGETSRFTDNYGTLVPDVDHHGLLIFDQRALAPDRLRHDEQSLTALALAARSSAAFPGAFEPSFIPVGESIEAEPGIPERPDMRDYANMTRSHWTADGGMLANRPLSPLLSAVFARPADREVRRILAFVVPDGGGTGNPADVPADLWAKPFTFARALRADLDAQLSQSIASDLRAIQAHNEQVQSGHDLRRTLAELGTRLAPQGLITPQMLDDYRRQQGSALARPLLDALMRELTTIRLPDSWKHQLGPSREADLPPIEQRLARKMTDRFTGTWTYPPAGEDPEDVFAHAARFGRPALDAAQAIAVQLVRYGYRLATEGGHRKDLAAHRRAISDAVTRPAPFDDRETVRDLVRAAASACPVTTLEQLAAQLADARWEALTRGGPSAPGDVPSLADDWRHLEQATASLITTLRKLAAQAASQRRNRPDAARAVSTYLGYLSTPGAGVGGIASRLLDLVIAERALEPVGAQADQPVEFIQVSANTRTQLSDQDTVSKLRGVGLHHFAAFYKSSWRAYDWMWGRLDGCGWLVHILLDPHRILAVCEDHPDVYGEPHERPEKFLDALLTAVGMSDVDEASWADMLKSLQFLADPKADIPVGLPDFALFIAQAWQQLIAANELPIVAREMLIDDSYLPAQEEQRRPGQARGRKPGGAPDNWAITVHEMDQRASAGEFARMLSSCPVRDETLAGQMRTPAFAQTATKAMAVAAAAATAAPEVPAQVKPVLASARTVTRTGYLATRVTGGKPRIMFILGLAAAIIGGVLATQGMIIVGVTGTAIALAGLYVIVVSAWGINRSLLGALAGITVLAALASLTLAWVRRFLWGKGEQKDLTGWVPAHVLPWLNSTWWGGLAVLGGFLTLAMITGIAWHRRPPRKP
jgi:patatin-related protein